MENKYYKERIKNAKKVIIYGAHAIAKDLWKYLEFHQMGNKVLGFAVSSTYDNPSKIDDLYVKEIAFYTEYNKEVLVLIATPEKFFEEIKEQLCDLKFNQFLEIGNWGIASLQNEDVLDYFKQNHPQFSACQDIYEDLCIRLVISNKHMKFMPLAAYPFDKETISYLNNIEKDGYLLKKLDNIEEAVYEKDNDNDTDLRVYVVSSPKDLQYQKEEKRNSWEYPIIGGAFFLKDEDETYFLRDDIGENISQKNVIYAEMTVAYWIWKNCDATYKGISHYRRRYVLKDADIDGLMLGKYDVLLTIPRLVLPSVRKWFTKVTSLEMQDIDLLGKCVADLYPACTKDICLFLDGHILYPNNMVIARKNIYDEYCQWIFSILEILEKEDMYKTLRSRRRYAAYVAELLTAFYFLCVDYKSKVKVVDYKLLESGGINNAKSVNYNAHT